jgi:DNA-binding transcriptional regulator YiaG
MDRAEREPIVETRPTARGHRKFSEIRRPATLERRAHVQAIAAAMEEAERLFEVRKARGVTQVELADRLGVSQGSLSELERRGEAMFLSTLRGYIEGLGGRLRLLAEFPEGSVPIRLEAGQAGSEPGVGSEPGLTKKRSTIAKSQRC